MSWKETCLMEERLKFMAAWLSEEESRSSLCERYGVSRKTGYKWAARYKREGLGGLSDRSRAPQNLPHYSFRITPHASAPKSWPR